MSQANASAARTPDFHAAANSGDGVMTRVMEVLREVRSQEAAGFRVSGEARLADMGFTSVDMVKVMLATEAVFDLTIPQHDITPENFTSAHTIAAMIGRLLANP